MLWKSQTPWTDLGPFVVQCVEASEVEKKKLSVDFFERKKETVLEIRDF